MSSLAQDDYDRIASKIRATVDMSDANGEEWVYETLAVLEAEKAAKERAAATPARYYRLFFLPCIAGFMFAIYRLLLKNDWKSFLVGSAAELVFGFAAVWPHKIKSKEQP